MSANNLDSRLQSQEIYLDSFYSTINNNATGNGDVYFFLTAPIYVPNDHDIVMRVDNFTMPISFYVINATNNSLYVNNTLRSIGLGNYTGLSLASTLTSITGLTVSFNSTLGTLNFVSGSPFTLNNSSTCFSILGFGSGDQVAVFDGVSTYTLNSSYVVNLSGTPVIYVDIPNLTTRNISSKTGGITTIIKSLVNNVPYGSILTYVNQTNSAVVLKEKYISYIHCRLLDSNYNVLNLNNCNWTMTLEFYFYYNGAPLTPSNISLNELVKQTEQLKNNLALNK